MDIVICLASKDYKIVKKVILYCHQFLQKQDDTIYLITHVSNRYFFPDRWLSAHHALLIDEDSLVEQLTFDNVSRMLKSHFKNGINIYPGWYFQQFLKMGFASSKYAKDDYLIWDSDTIPLRELHYKDGEKYLFTVKTECHHPYFATSQKLLGIGKLCDHSFIAEHMPINVRIMRELLLKINASDVAGTYWFEMIINATSGSDEQAFSEFETYGNYCQKYHREFFSTRQLITLRTAGLLFGRGVTTRHLSLLAKMGFDTASFELRDIPSFPYNIANWWERIVLRIYRQFGLIKK